MTTTDTDAPERIAIDPDYVPDHSQHFGTLVKYIRADLAKPRVKPLVWEFNEDGNYYKAKVFDEEISLYENADGTWTAAQFDRLGEPYVDRGPYTSHGEAVLAEQQIHEAHVLAQLEGET